MGKKRKDTEASFKKFFRLFLFFFTIGLIIASIILLMHELIELTEEKSPPSTLEQKKEVYRSSK